MERRQFTAEEVLWVHSTTKAGLHPLKIKITYNRNTRYYPVQLDGRNVYLSPGQMRGIEEKNVRGDNKRIKDAIVDGVAKARQTFQALTANKRPFTFERFEKEYILNTSSTGFIKFFEDYLAQLLKEQRVGSHHTYHCALQAFRAFRNGRDLDPLDITPDLLRDFETYLKHEKVSTSTRGKRIVRKAGKTTISIYMRALRAVYNFITGKLPHLRESYPFTTHTSDRTKYRIKAGSGSKGDALPISQLRIFQNAKVIESSPEWRAKNLWLFSFYCNGMNFNDMARLKYSDIKKDYIAYVRHKTKETEGNSEVIEIPLNDAIRNIIIDLGNPSKRPSDYVFDLLDGDLKPIEERVVINQKLKIVNKWLKRICEANDLPPITTYWARHSYASLLKDSGESVELIRELLGHSDVRTTENYLKRFDLGKKKEANDRLHALMKKAS